MTEISK